MSLFFRQDVGQVLLISEQVCVAPLRCDGLEPFLVRQEEEEACEVLLADDLHRLFLETILQCQFLSGAYCCKRVGGDKVPVSEGQHAFVLHAVVKPCAPSARVDCVHLRGERLVELVRALIRPLRAEIQIRVGLHGRHDDPLPVRLV